MNVVPNFVYKPHVNRKKTTRTVTQVGQLMRLFTKQLTYKESKK